MAQVENGNMKMQLFNFNLLQLGFVLMLVSTFGGCEKNCPPKCICQETAIRCAEYCLTIVPDFGTIQNNPLSVDLSSNDIDEIGSTSFQSIKFESLQYLYLNENIIWHIANTAFVPLKNLQVLDLSYNFLTKVPSDMIERNLQMQQLNLSSNDFGGRTPELVSSSLKILDLSLCNINTFIGGNVKGLGNLQVLFLHANYLKHIDVNIFNNVNLKQISLGYNFWKCDSGTKKLFEYFAKQNVVIDKSMPCNFSKNRRY